MDGVRKGKGPNDRPFFMLCLDAELVVQENLTQVTFFCFFAVFMAKISFFPGYDAKKWQ